MRINYWLAFFFFFPFAALALMLAYMNAETYEDLNNARWAQRYVDLSIQGENLKEALEVEKSALFDVLNFKTPATKELFNEQFKENSQAIQRFQRAFQGLLALYPKANSLPDIGARFAAASGQRAGLTAALARQSIDTAALDQLYEALVESVGDVSAHGQEATYGALANNQEALRTLQSIDYLQAALAATLEEQDMGALILRSDQYEAGTPRFLESKEMAHKNMENFLAQAPKILKLAYDTHYASNGAMAAYGKAEAFIMGRFSQDTRAVSLNQWHQLSRQRVQSIQQILGVAKRHLLAVSRSNLQEAESDFYTLLWGSIAFLAFFFGAGMYGLYCVGGGLCRAIGRIKELAQGNTWVARPKDSSVKEINELIAAFDMLKKQATQALGLNDRLSAEMQERDNVIGSALLQMANEADGKLDDLFNQVTVMAGQILHANTTMKGSVEDICSHLKKTTASAASISGELSDTMKSADSLQLSLTQATSQIETTAADLKRAKETSEQAQHVVRKLTDQATDINEIILSMSSIAHQTNLLAISATIEASRAGEFGKGFAVVASEVKKLSTQTTEATKSIARQVSSILDVRANTKPAFEKIVQSVGGATELACQIAATMAAQNTAAKRITQGNKNAIELAKGAEYSLDSVTKDMEVTISSSSQIQQDMACLLNHIKKMRQEMRHFLRDRAIGEGRKPKGYPAKDGVPQKLVLFTQALATPIEVTITNISDQEICLKNDGFSLVKGERIEFKLPTTRKKFLATVCRIDPEEIRITFAPNTPVTQYIKENFVHQSAVAQQVEALKPPSEAKGEVAPLIEPLQNGTPAEGLGAKNRGTENEPPNGAPDRGTKYVLAEISQTLHDLRDFDAAAEKALGAAPFAVAKSQGTPTPAPNAKGKQEAARGGRALVLLEDKRNEIPMLEEASLPKRAAPAV